MTATTNRAQWERFAGYVAQGHNQTQAAILTGYAERSAQVRGAELMQIPEVRELVERKRLNLQAQTDWTPVRIIQELAKLAQEARADGNHATARACYRDIGEHIGMWPRQPISIDARQQILQLPALQNASIDELRQIAGSHPYIEQPPDDAVNDASDDI